MVDDHEVLESGGTAGAVKGLRPAEIARALWGACLVIRPRDVLALVHHAPTDPLTVAVARVLGARHLAQAAATVHRPSPELVAVGVYSDASHALSMIALAVASSSRRRAGLTDAAIALAFAAAGSAGLRSPAPRDRQQAGRAATLARTFLVRVPGGSVLLNSIRLR